MAAPLKLGKEQPGVGFDATNCRVPHNMQDLHGLLKEASTAQCMAPGLLLSRYCRAPRDPPSRMASDADGVQEDGEQQRDRGGAGASRGVGGHGILALARFPCNWADRLERHVRSTSTRH